MGKKNAPEATATNSSKRQVRIFKPAIAKDITIQSEVPVMKAESKVALPINIMKYLGYINKYLQLNLPMQTPSQGQ